jgi:hypothetical protein
MNAIATRLQGLQVTTAAVAVAAAATMVPVAAQAAPEISLPTAPITQVLDNLALAPSEGTTVPCNSIFFCFGAVGFAENPNLVVAFTLGFPILGPILIQPLLNAIGLANRSICLGGFGVSNHAPYGHITLSLSLGCQ